MEHFFHVANHRKAGAGRLLRLSVARADVVALCGQALDEMAAECGFQVVVLEGDWAG